MNVLITGGNFKNKGAQAMVFTVVQEVKSRFPSSNIWMLNLYNENIEDVYNFSNIYFGRKTLARLNLGKMKFLIKPDDTDEVLIENLFKEADLIMDVSGYAFKNNNGGFKRSILYLLQITLAKKYNKKIILLPQSFGPFKFKRIHHKVILKPLMKKLLKYPLKIYAREEKGYNEIKGFTKNNISKSLDIVLQNNKYETSIIYNKPQEYNKHQVKDNTIGIVPNIRNISYNEKGNNLSNIYDKLINISLENNFNVTILNHSNEDLDLCLKIYENYKHDDKVSLINDDLSCIELYDIINRMEILVASRYHSLIHSYKGNVPALVIGWAEKYYEVMDHFNQTKYYFDIRNKIGLNDLEKSYIDLIKSHKKEENKIKEINEKMLGNSIFEEIFREQL